MSVAATGPGRLEPGRLEPGRLEPGRLEPGRLEPGHLEPGRMEPASGPELAAALLCRVCAAWDPERFHELVVTAGADGFAPAFEAIRAGSRARFGMQDVPDTDWGVAVRLAAEADPVRTARTLAANQVSVTWVGADGYPDGALADADPPPGVLMSRGDAAVLGSGSRVAVVGTRTPTVAGAQFAFALGRDLARAGVQVVSGLARGIDGAAHRGAITAAGAPVVGVVGSGLDVIYPAEHRDLWEAVAAHGLLLSETGLGQRPDKRRFTRRNRLLAALADVVVVVESAASGGSLSTARHALDRGRTLLAVPGGPWSPVSAGTNALVRSGQAKLCRSAADVLAELGRAPAPVLPDLRPEPGDVGARVLRALGWEVMSLDTLATRAGLPRVVTRTVLGGLERDGWVRHAPHGWFQVAGARSA